MILFGCDESAARRRSGTQRATTYGRNNEPGNSAVVANETQMYRRRNARDGNIGTRQRITPA
jgi:hypothetical protein